MAMQRCPLGVLLFVLALPALAAAQGRETKVYYDSKFALGSQALDRLETHYFEILTTPASEDPHSDLMRYWGPKLDQFYQNVCDNLALTRAEVFRYLIYPDHFSQIEKRVLAGELGTAQLDSVVRLTIEVLENGKPRPHEPLVFARSDLGAATAGPSVGIGATAPASTVGLPERRFHNATALTSDSVYVWLPEPRDRYHQRCVLYRTLSDFIATPIGPALPEGVLGFVPTRDPKRPVVIYASLGENKLDRTAQHEIGHAVVEGVASYIRSLEVTRMLRHRKAKADTTAPKPWTPASGGFAGITHENYAEFLAFPCGQMDPTLRAALIEMVAENRIDGLAALSVGARTIASSYVEGPARLVFLAENFGHDFPKRLLVTYYTRSIGFLDAIEELSGKSIPQLEQLYKHWMRERFWSLNLAADIPDTMGRILASGWSAVRRDGETLVQRGREGRQEIVLVRRAQGRHGKLQETRVTRDLDGNDHLPLFSSPDLRAGHVVAVRRSRNRESLLLWDRAHGAHECKLASLGTIREIYDPRLSPSGASVVCRVVDRSGRNGIAHVDVATGRNTLIVPWQWTEVGYPSFAESETQVLFSSTAALGGKADVFLLDLATGKARNLTRTPASNEIEPSLVNGHLVVISDGSGVPEPTLVTSAGASRLANLPFPVNRMQRCDSSLALVAHSLRHEEDPAGRAVWEFPLRRFGLATAAAPDELAPVVAEAEVESDPLAALSGDGTGPFDGSFLATDVAGAGAAAQPTTHRAHTAATPPSFLLDPMRAPVPGAGADIAPYKQKWHLMPLGINMGGVGASTNGIGMMGFDTEFHDQSVILAAGQSDALDRFGLIQYRNRTSRTHWQASGYYRSTVSAFYAPDTTNTVHRQITDEGLLLAAQYHQSLVTRFGLGLAITKRSDATGHLLARTQDTAPPPAQAPIAGLQLGGLHPSTWRFSAGGLQDLRMLCDRSRSGLATWTEAEKSNSTPTEFLPVRDYVRPNATLGASWSRDTRVWSDYRGPNSGTLFLVEVSGGVNAPGTRTAYSSTQHDSTSAHVAMGLDRASESWLLLSHRRVSFVDLAFRWRGILDHGPEALVYGLGGLHSVSGFRRGGVRSERITWVNTEARAQLWDYSSWRFPFHALVLPAADGFLYADSGVADGSGPLYGYGVGLRLRLGFLAFEWRKALRPGLRDERGLSFVW